MIGFDIFESYNVTLEIYIENKLVQQQNMQAPKEMLMMNFIQNVEQISKDQRPIKIKMIIPDIIWDKFKNKEKVLNNEVTFSNNTMIDWENNKT